MDNALALNNEVGAMDRSRTNLLAPVFRYVLAVIYGTIMVVLYERLSAYWAYLGFDFTSIGALTFPLVVISATPAMLLPSRPTSLTQFASWLLFFTLFLPAMIIPQLQGWVTGFRAITIFALVWASTLAFIAIGRLPNKPVPRLQFSSKLFWIGLLGLWFVMHGAIYVALSGELAFAAIGSEVYEQRADAEMSIQSGLLLYILSNASGAVNPALIAIGWFEKKWWAIGLGVLGQLLVYGTLAGKIVLMFPIVIVGVYFLFANGRLLPIRLALTMIGVAVVGVPLHILRDDLPDLAIQFIDLIYMRTLYLPGVLVGAYQDFFSLYPITYFSHSIIGRLFSDYPFGTWSVGQVVGAYVTPGTGYTVNNYNANFIAADGIAGFGPLGIPLIMLVAILVLRGMDKLLGNLDLRVRCAALIPFLIWLADGSLPTALLTGGGGLVAAIMWVYSGVKAKPVH